MDNIEFFTSNNPNPVYPTNEHIAFPIPTKNKKINIAFKYEIGEDVAVQIIDLSGKMVKTLSYQNVLNQTYEIDLGTTNPGIYLMRIVTSTSSTIERIVVDR